MNYCKNCGNELPTSAKFCHKCGAQTEVSQVENTQAEYANNENVYAQYAQHQAYQQPETAGYSAPEGAAYPVITVDSREDEQKALDALSTRLKHQRLAWKISSFVLMALLIFFVLFGSVFAIVGGAVIADNQSYTYDDYDYNDFDYGYNDNYDEFFNDFYNEYDEYFNDRFYEFNSLESNTAVGNDAEDFVGIFFLIYGLYFVIIGILAFLPSMIVGFIMSKKVKKYRDSIYTDCSDAVKHSTSVGNIVLGALFNDIALVFIIINFVITKKNRVMFDRIIENQRAYNAQCPQN